MNLVKEKERDKYARHTQQRPAKMQAKDRN